MNLFVCEHPRKVKNPYTGEQLLVPCGKCKSCLVRHSYSWVERLEVERKCHPYTLFFTLTYSDDFCPKVFFDPETETCYDNIDGEVLSYDDLELNNQDIDSIKSRKYVDKRGWLTFPYVPHLQKFIKRIRSKVFENENCINKKRVRYFIVSEYGPTNKRIHYHGLLFFESDWFANHAEEVIASAWSTDNRNTDVVSFGRSDCDFVQGSATSYCAQYINSTDHLPKVLKLGKFKNVSIMSRHPPIGSLPIKSAEIQEVFDKCLTSLRLYSPRKQKLVDVPLSRSLEDRLFPRIKGFDTLDHTLRVELYSYLSRTKQKVIDYESFISSLDCIDCDGFSTDACIFIRKFISNQSESCTHRFYSVLRRCEYLLYSFGCTYDSLVSKIERYYINRDYDRLKNQMLMQESYKGDVSDFLYLDSVYHQALIMKRDLSPLDYLILRSYGWNEDDMSAFDFLTSKDYSKHIDYINLVSRSKSIFEHSCKNKQKKEYIRQELHTDDF